MANKYEREVSRILDSSKGSITESELNYISRVGALVSAPFKLGIAVVKAAADLGMMVVTPDGSGRFDDKGVRRS